MAASTKKNPQMTKKLLNSPQRCVIEAIDGFLSWNPGLVGLPKHPSVVLRRDWMDRAGQGKVAIVTGGGSGHEPCFVGFVGDGMATAAIHGHVFAAPSSVSILETLMTLGRAGEGGILIIFNNYTGDRLNFGIAAEKAKSRGVKLEVVINSDDCALQEGARPNCRRGLSGLILLLKIVGHMADSGDKLEKIANYAKQALPKIATMGVAWSSCSLPGNGPLFEIGQTEMEIGLGMHGEAGIKRIPMMNTKDTVSLLLKHMTDNNLSTPFMEIKKGDRIVVLLNNMGSTSDIEMNVFAREAILQLGQFEGAFLDRMYVGRYVTSQEMAGISITIMTTDHFTNDCLDAKTSALSWVTPVTASQFTMPSRDHHVDDNDNGSLSAADDGDGGDGGEKGPHLSNVAHTITTRALMSIANSLIANTTLLNAWDSSSGDGDCGSTFAAGSKGLLKLLQKSSLLETRNCCRIIDMLSSVVETEMGGTSGGLYSLFLTSISQELATEPTNGHLTSQLCIRAIRKGIDTIMRYGGAMPGDRTMVDPLNAACQYLEKEVETMETVSLWQQAVKVADLEMKKTTDMVAKVGRASNVRRSLQTQPDPGAKACCVWLSAIVNTLIDNKKNL